MFLGIISDAFDTMGAWFFGLLYDLMQGGLKIVNALQDVFLYLSGVKSFQIQDSNGVWRNTTLLNFMFGVSTDADGSGFTMDWNSAPHRVYFATLGIFVGVLILCIVISIFKTQMNKDDKEQIPAMRKMVWKSFQATVFVLLLPLFFGLLVCGSCMLFQYFAGILQHNLLNDTNGGIANGIFLSILPAEAYRGWQDGLANGIYKSDFFNWEMNWATFKDHLSEFGVSYNGWNVLFAYISTFCCLVALLMATITLTERLINIVLQYLVSPFVLASMPLDDGKRWETWKDITLAKVLSAGGNIISMFVFLYVMVIVRQVVDTLSANANFAEVFTLNLLYCVVLIAGSFSASKGGIAIANLISSNAGQQEGMGFMASQQLLKMGLGTAKAVAGAGVLASKKMGLGSGSSNGVTPNVNGGASAGGGIGGAQDGASAFSNGGTGLAQTNGAINNAVGNTGAGASAGGGVGGAQTLSAQMSQMSSRSANSGAPNIDTASMDNKTLSALSKGVIHGQGAKFNKASKMAGMGALALGLTAGTGGLGLLGLGGLALAGFGAVKGARKGISAVRGKIQDKKEAKSRANAISGAEGMSKEAKALRGDASKIQNDANSIKDNLGKQNGNLTTAMDDKNSATSKYEDTKKQNDIANNQDSEKIKANEQQMKAMVGEGGDASKLTGDEKKKYDTLQSENQDLKKNIDNRNNETEASKQKMDDANSKYQDQYNKATDEQKKMADDYQQKSTEAKQMNSQASEMESESKKLKEAQQSLKNDGAFLKANKDLVASQRKLANVTGKNDAWYQKKVSRNEERLRKEQGRAGQNQGQLNVAKKRWEEENAKIQSQYQSKMNTKKVKNAQDDVANKKGNVDKMLESSGFSSSSKKLNELREKQNSAKNNPNNNPNNSNNNQSQKENEEKKD